jgi:hypothetical protein
MGKEITMDEIDNLAMSAIILTYECGMRFLSDYLDGDRYFKIEPPSIILIVREHNSGWLN